MDIELSIIMPCLNEAETLEICIRKATDFLERAGINGEIVIGDNGSIDGSQEIARRCGAYVIDAPIRGYGAALYGAVMASRGKYCIMGDADDSYDFAALDAFVEHLRAGADLAMGNRFRGGVAPGAMPWKNRYIGNPVLSGLGRLFFGSPVSDFHCGLRGFSREAFSRMDLRTTGMEFASEMVIKATLLEMKIVEVPTTLRPDGRSRAPHLRPYRDGWRHLRMMLVFSPNWLFFYPGLLLLLFGLVFGGTLFFRPLLIGGIRFSIDTMIYCAAACEIGFQLVLFSVLSKALAVQQSLLKKSRTMRVLDRVFRIERALGAGLILVFGGALLLVRALMIWSHAGFGGLNADDFSRIVVASSTLMSLGLECIFSGFLLGLIRVNVRWSSRPAEFQG